MKCSRESTLTLAIAVVLLLAAGCGSKAAHARPSQAAPRPVSTAAEMAGTCTVGFMPSGQGAVFIAGQPQGETINGTYYAPTPGYRLTLQNGSASTAAVTGFAVAFYDTSGTEMGSDERTFDSTTYITQGQSLTWYEYAPTTTDGLGGNANIPDGAATCQMVTWYRQ